MASLNLEVRKDKSPYASCGRPLAATRAKPPIQTRKIKRTFGLTTTKLNLKYFTTGHRLDQKEGSAVIKIFH